MALLGYFVLGRFGNLLPVVWLALASLAFYAVSNWQFVALLLGSIAFNYVIGLLLIRKPAARSAAVCGPHDRRRRRSPGARHYFKYAGFLAANFNALFSDRPHRQHPAAGRDFLLHLHPDRLPGGRLPGKGRGLRVAALRAVRHLFPASDRRADPAPQGHDPAVRASESKRPDPHLILCGLIIFAIGLFKKTALADGIQPLVALAFGPATPSFDQAWIGALAYTFQLYFDFSGYCDMAIGISLMFGMFLPLNFNSPYKAASIIDFWRRWHMTLSQFLRDYLYIPLGGNRRGRDPALRQSDDHDGARRALARRGLDLCRLGRAARPLSLHQPRLESIMAPRSGRASTPVADIAAFVLTFLAVVVAWVFFRADSMASALFVLSKMADPTQIAFGHGEMA